MTAVLFNFMNPESIPINISVGALKAADNFVSMSAAHSLHCLLGVIEVANKQAESHKNICTMQLECLMFVNVMPAAMNRSSKSPCMRSLFVYALVYRSISEWCISGGPGTLV